MFHIEHCSYSRSYWSTDRKIRKHTIIKLIFIFLSETDCLFNDCGKSQIRYPSCLCTFCFKPLCHGVYFRQLSTKNDFFYINDYKHTIGYCGVLNESRMICYDIVAGHHDNLSNRRGLFDAPSWNVGHLTVPFDLGFNSLYKSYCCMLMKAATTERDVYSYFCVKYPI